MNFLYGKNDYTVTLSNNLEVKFSITSTAVFYSDFDNVYCPEEWNFNLQTCEVIENGINGGKSLHLGGNGGSTLLMGKSFYRVNFDTTKTYKLSLKIKNLLDETEAENKYLFFGFNLDDYSKTMQFTYKFISKVDTCNNPNLTVTHVEDGVMLFEYTFVPAGETYIEGYFGYDPSDPTKKLFDVLIDDIVIYMVD